MLFPASNLSYRLAYFYICGVKLLDKEFCSRSLFLTSRRMCLSRISKLSLETDLMPRAFKTYACVSYLWLFQPPNRDHHSVICAPHSTHNHLYSTSSLLIASYMHFVTGTPSLTLINSFLPHTLTSRSERVAQGGEGLVCTSEKWTK